MHNASWRKSCHLKYNLKLAKAKKRRSCRESEPDPDKKSKRQIIANENGMFLRNVTSSSSDI